MFIGIDVGTSGVKVLLVTSKGVIKRTVSRQYDLMIPKPSWTEQDPDVWYNQTLDALEELVKGYEDKIEAISFSGQMHGLVCLDEHDTVIRHAILWNDQRTVKQVDYLNNDISKEFLLKHTGNIALTGLTAPKVLWLKDNEPENFKKIAKIMLPKDYIIYKLSNCFVSDVSDLSGTLFFNPKTRDYSDEMLDVLGITRDMLPKVYESYEVVGTLSDKLKDHLNISQDVTIVAGGGDQAVGAIGVGVVKSGASSISLGTSGVIFVSSDTFNIDRKSYFQSYAHANGKYHIMAVMLNAANAIKWWSESIHNNNDYESFYKGVASATISDDLFFLPYLNGERAPINDATAKGVFYGLGIHHKKIDLDRAVVEGVTFALRDSFELIKNLGVDIKRIRLTGGGAKSDIWAQLIADVLNIEVTKIKSEEGPALGAAILAMVGNTTYPTVEQACETIVELSKTFKPNNENMKLYNKKYKKHVIIYPTMKTLYKQI